MRPLSTPDFYGALIATTLLIVSLVADRVDEIRWGTNYREFISTDKENYCNGTRLEHLKRY